jgi:hypothetical protein
MVSETGLFINTIPKDNLKIGTPLNVKNLHENTPVKVIELGYFHLYRRC